MPTLNNIPDGVAEIIPVRSIPWLSQTASPGLIRGGCYLVAGPPGIGKSTLANQVAGGLAKHGVKVLYVSTEQGLGDLKRGVERIHGRGNGRLSQALRDNYYIDDSLGDVDNLPRFLTRRVLTDGQDYHGVQVIVIDSVQGRGLASTATQKYRALYEFIESAKAQGIVTILIGHVTKKGEIAGPRDLEHNVDCVLYIRSAFRLRLLFVPKNRFGPASLEPLVLTMDTKGRLRESPHAMAKSCTVYGYGGVGDALAEGQASICLPRYGSRPELNAPFLPAKKVKQLITVLNTLNGVDLNNFSYEINAYIPGRQAYQQELDLPLTLALLSSYIRRPVPSRTLFVGELDLSRSVRPPDPGYLTAVANVVIGTQRGKIRQVFIADQCAEEFSQMQPEEGGPRVGELVQVRGVTRLEQLIGKLWPDLLGRNLDR